MPACNVRFGSKADIVGCQLDVRFTPKSGRRLAKLGSFCNYVRGGQLLLAAVAGPFCFGT
jgi:hypothetical protein